MHETTTTVTLGAEAIGTIGPKGRNLDLSTLSELREDLRGGRFYVSTEKLIPDVCIDGRSSKNQKIGPNAAGGTMTLVVADALTTDAFRTEGNGSAGHLAEIAQHLQANGYEIGGHQDEHKNEVNCGCGACDKLGIILNFIAINGDTVRNTLRKLGVEINDELHDALTAKAAGLVEESYASPGVEVANAFKAAVPANEAENVTPVLTGSHNEVEIQLNFRAGTTLDRHALEEVYGPEHQVFNVDVWAFEEAARAVSATEEEVADKMNAMLYYNVAVAYVLGNESLGFNALT